jgi:integrase
LHWATNAGDGQGGVFLERDPLDGLPYPKDESPRRPVLNEEHYRALIAASQRVSPLFELALIVAHETGHRIGAIRLLRWCDVDFDKRSIRWRAANDKIGFAHETPLTQAVLSALTRRRLEHPSIGDAWVFPAPGHGSEPCSRHLFRDWWQQGEVLAGISHQTGLGWHSLRRKFATELKHMPLKDLCYLGGWKEPQTVLKCYQQPDELTMRDALARRRQSVVG